MKKLILSSFVLAASFLAACSSDSAKAPSKGQEPAPTNFSETKMVNRLVGQVHVTALQKLIGNLESIQSATDNRCSIDAGNNEDFKGLEKLKAIQDYWKSAMLAYHRLEPQLVGPFSIEKADSVALALKIYSWPKEVAKCNVDLNVLKISEGTGYQPPYSLNTHGLDSLEYLLFDKFKSVNCSPIAADYQALQAWVVKSEVEKIKDRCSYIHHVSKQLIPELKQVESYWSSFDEKAKGFDTKPLQAFYEAMVNFADKVLKDRKLGVVTGIKNKASENGDEFCPGFKTSCPEKAEHRLSNLGFEALYENYVGMLNVFSGTTAVGATPENEGIYGYMVYRGEKPLADKIYSHLFNSVLLLDTYKDKKLDQVASEIDKAACASTTVEDRREPLCALYRDAKVYSDILKNEFRTFLSLKDSPVVEGDGD